MESRRLAAAGEIADPWSSARIRDRLWDSLNTPGLIPPDDAIRTRMRSEFNASQYLNGK